MVENAHNSIAIAAVKWGDVTITRNRVSKWLGCFVDGFEFTKDFQLECGTLNHDTARRSPNVFTGYGPAWQTVGDYEEDR
mgnify:CR=1 FL=1